MKIIKYGADWCGPCRETSKVLKDSGYEVIEIDIDADENEELVFEKHITTIPVVEFYNNDSKLPVYTHIGLLTKEELSNIIKDKVC